MGLRRHLQEIVGCQRQLEPCHDAVTASHHLSAVVGGLLLLADGAIDLGAHLLGYLIVDASLCRVHVGMHRHDGNALAHGTHHHALHIVLTGEPRQLAEDEGMMAHNEIATVLDGLIENGIGNV